MAVVGLPSDGSANYNRASLGKRLMANPCVVTKFGGTSVGDPKAIARMVEIVRGRLPGRPIVVVSAMAKVTDQLLQMARAAGSGDRQKALILARECRERHYNTAGELLGTALFTQFHAELGAEFEELEELLRGIAAVGELTPRTADHVAAYGEVLSSKLVAAALSAHDVPGVYVDSRECIVTDETFMRAAPLFDDTNARLKEFVAPLVERGEVPVMGGFVGATRGGVTTTIGRGGSDFSAAIVGAGLNADKIEIWTDVDGMMTTDPNICPDARRIKLISFDEAAELAYFGAKVLHPATVLPAIQKNIPVYILNSQNPSCEGTRITARAPHCKNFFKAIAAKKRITIVDVAAPRMLLAHGFLKAIFEAFDRHRIPVDVVSTSEVSVSLTVDSNESIPALAADLAKLADVKYEGRKAIVCLVGENLREIPGIAAHVFGELSDVKIRMISQGASEINLTFVIDEELVPNVIQRLHKRFFDELDPVIFA
jgi:aspartate kinase